MVTAAYFAPLWFALMDKRVAAHYHGDLTRANVQPTQRAKQFARWHQPLQNATTQGAA